MIVKSLRFPASWSQDGIPRDEVAEFRLGLGPCGRTVTRLGYEIGDGCLHILQEHSDAPQKRFVYPLSQLTGRIEAEFQPWNF
jgi:hypothetical protein